MSYQSMTEMLSGCAAVSKKLVARNTVEWADAEGNRYIRLHETDIITTKPDGTVILTTGGWKTNVTKERLNEFGPGQLSVKKGIWTLELNGQSYTFNDGRTIHADGLVEGVGDSKKAEVLLKKIRAYAHAFAIALVQGKVEEPSGGDCWNCSMDKLDTGNDHLLSHIKEKYYVPSLLMNAVKQMGASKTHKNDIGLYLSKDTSNFKFYDERSFLENTAKILDRYLSMKLGVA